MSDLNLDLARQIAVNSGDIRDVMESLIEEVERVRDNPPPEFAVGLHPTIDMLFEAGSQFRVYQQQHEGKANDPRRSADEREQHRTKGNINKALADRIDGLVLAAGAPHGWISYGPDGEWHWSMSKPDHPEVEDPRPATSLERGLLTIIGGSTAGTREFNDWKEAQPKPVEPERVEHSGYVDTLDDRPAAPGAELGAAGQATKLGDDI